LVRDAASETLGVLMKLIGEPIITKLMPDLDAIKMAKVKEFSDKAEITGKRPKLQPEGGNAPTAKAGAKVVKPGGPPKKPIGKFNLNMYQLVRY
jgi:cytoskeleton-associated protein 5